MPSCRMVGTWRIAFDMARMGMNTITAPDGSALSPLCFGAMQFGGNADETDARAMYDACRAAGVNFFDTAHAYTEGRS